MGDDGVRACVEALAAEAARFPGVAGEAATAARFAGQWTETTNSAAIPKQGQRIYEAGPIAEPDGVPGDFRRAAEDDKALLGEWLRAFNSEVHEQGGDPDAVICRRVAKGEFWVWEDERPVSMAALTEPVAGVARVQAVYTPPELRARGLRVRLRRPAFIDHSPGRNWLHPLHRSGQPRFEFGVQKDRLQRDSRLFALHGPLGRSHDSSGLAASGEAAREDLCRRAGPNVSRERSGRGTPRCLLVGSRPGEELKLDVVGVPENQYKRALHPLGRRRGRKVDPLAAQVFVPMFEFCMVFDQKGNVIQPDPSFVKGFGAGGTMLGKRQSCSKAVVSKEDPPSLEAVLFSLTGSGEA